MFSLAITWRSALVPRVSLPILLLLFATTGSAVARADPSLWRFEWPNTNFERSSVDFDEIFSGGPPKDGIPSIDDPKFVPVAESGNLADREPVIGLEIDGDARAYPLRVLTWHEIVNDVVGGVPVAVTYCPLCNAAIVFDRRIYGEAVEFGTTGKLRFSDLVMYDRKTESWWQQFQGEAIIGDLTGHRLKVLPARLESWAKFRERFPQGMVLVPNNPGLRRYGANPYVGYDSASVPFLYRGSYPEGITPMARVVVVEDQAWPLTRLRQEGRIESGNILLRWEEGQASALDSGKISEGREVGNVTVQIRRDGALVDLPYDVTFAFVFHAFRPNGKFHLE